MLVKKLDLEGTDSAQMMCVNICGLQFAPLKLEVECDETYTGTTETTLSACNSPTNEWTPLEEDCDLLTSMDHDDAASELSLGPISVEARQATPQQRAVCLDSGAGGSSLGESAQDACFKDDDVLEGEAGCLNTPASPRAHLLHANVLERLFSQAEPPIDMERFKLRSSNHTPGPARKTEVASDARNGGRSALSCVASVRCAADSARWKRQQIADLHGTCTGVQQQRAAHSSLLPHNLDRVASLGLARQRPPPLSWAGLDDAHDAAVGMDTSGVGRDEEAHAGAAAMTVDDSFFCSPPAASSLGHARPHLPQPSLGVESPSRRQKVHVCGIVEGEEQRGHDECDAEIHKLDLAQMTFQSEVHSCLPTSGASVAGQQQQSGDASACGKDAGVDSAARLQLQGQHDVAPEPVADAVKQQQQQHTPAAQAHAEVLPCLHIWRQHCSWQTCVLVCVCLHRTCSCVCLVLTREADLVAGG